MTERIMSDLVETSQESTNNNGLLASEASVTPSGTQSKPLSALLYLFAVALAVRLWFNFGTEHINCYGVSDASEYLRYATALSKLNFAAPVFGPEWKEFAISGPTFPFFLWLCSALTFSPFNAANSDLFLTAQSLISAATAVFIAIATGRLWNRKTGLVAGYIAAFYPAFIVNSGRLYSETFATFLEMAALVILVRLFFTRAKAVAFCIGLGVLLVLLQLTRSSMILFTVSALAAVAMAATEGKLTNWRPALKAVLATIFGMTLILAPWFIFQKTAFNKMSPIVDRVGNYNLFIGTNSDIQGFLSYPYPDGNGIEKKSFATLTQEALKKSSSRFIKLALDKPARLYKFPWNDFRISIGPVAFQQQVLFHQIVILLSLCGLCLATVGAGRRLTAGRLLVILLVVLNLPYLAFITVPRYNLLAMPAFIIFAAAALTTLIDLIRANPRANAPKAVLLSGLALLLYLRDDIRAPFSFGSDTASLYIVQGTDLIARGITAGACALAFFVAIYLTINRLDWQPLSKRIARLLTVGLAILAVGLCAISQRANGRAGEGIITLNRPGEKLSGQILLPASALKKDEADQWFILVDSDQGQLLRNQFDLTLNGHNLLEPGLESGSAIAAISSLDDWNYLKTNSAGGSYLECAYIFDCLSGPAGVSNSDLRQWFAIPLNEEQLTITNEIAIEQKSSAPTKLFSAGLGHVIPSRAVYSWEKAFYGVENDSGLTDPRYDEKVSARQGKWSISYKGASEAIGEGLDLNVRLIKVKGNSLRPGIKPAESSGTGGEAQLAIAPALVLANQQLLGVNINWPGNSNKNMAPLIDATPLSPELYLTWTSDGHEHKLPLPGLLKITPGQPLKQSFVVNLGKTHGTNLQLHCSYPDKSASINLSAREINCHPFYSPQEIF